MIVNALQDKSEEFDNFDINASCPEIAAAIKDSSLESGFVFGVADIGAVITLPFTPSYIMIWNPKYESNARIEIYDNGKFYANSIDSDSAFNSAAMAWSWSKLNKNVITIGKNGRESCTQKNYIAWK